MPKTKANWGGPRPGSGPKPKAIRLRTAAQVLVLETIDGKPQHAGENNFALGTVTVTERGTVEITMPGGRVILLKV